MQMDLREITRDFNENPRQSHKKMVLTFIDLSLNFSLKTFSGLGEVLDQILSIRVGIYVWKFIGSILRESLNNS